MDLVAVEKSVSKVDRSSYRKKHCAVDCLWLSPRMVTVVAFRQPGLSSDQVLLSMLGGLFSRS